VDPSGYFFQFIIAAIAAVFVVAAVVSVVASTASLIAAATGHERTAARLAKVAGVSAQVAYWTGAALSVLTLGEASGTLLVAGVAMAYAQTAAGVARDVTDEGVNLPFPVAFSRQATNATLETVPGVSSVYGAGMAIHGVNPLTQEVLSPWQRAVALGGTAFLGLQRFLKARQAARWLAISGEPPPKNLLSYV